MERNKIGLSEARFKAIEMMDFIAEYLGDLEIFDCKNGDTVWYDIEDEIVNIIQRR